MFTPSAVIGMWLRGLISVAVIAGAVCLFALWYRELPEPPREVQPLPRKDLIEENSLSFSQVQRRVSFWRPGLDKPTALLTGAVFLSMLSIGAGGISYPLLRRQGMDEPSSSRSDRRIVLERPDGTNLNVEEFGRADGPTVVLTHGWGMDSTEWYYAKKELAKLYRVIVWDLPGEGLSTRAANDDYSVERFATDLHAIVQWTDAPRIMLVGHSIGGMILQTYARLFPMESKVIGLALVHTTYVNPLRTTKHGSLYSAIEKPVIVPLLYLTIVFSPLVWLMNVLSYLNGSTHRSTDKQSFSGNETRGQLNFTARFALVQSPAVLARGMLGMIHFDESNHLKNIHLPTLIVAGERDPVTLPSASQFMTNSIPKAQHVTLPTGRHQAQMELHAPFLQALKEFINNSLAGNTALPDRSGRAPLKSSQIFSPRRQ